MPFLAYHGNLLRNKLFCGTRMPVTKVPVADSVAIFQTPGFKSPERSRQPYEAGLLFKANIFVINPMVSSDIDTFFIETL